MVEFDRWKPWDSSGRTLAYRVFKKQHEELNDMYWSHEAAAQGFWAKADSLPGDELSEKHWKTRNKNDMRRLPDTVEKIKERYRYFDYWTRLNAIMAACSYLEVYLKTVIRLALDSDPGVVNRAPRRIDGVLFLKYGYDHFHLDRVRHVIQGEWSKRLSGYEKLFCELPSEMRGMEGDLEKIRNIRNSVGHAFGRAIGKDSRSVDLSAIGKDSRSVDLSAPGKDRRIVGLSVSSITILPLKTLKRYLGVVDEFAQAVDGHLANHIGAYELIRIYHDEVEVSPDLQDDVYALKKAISEKLGYGVNKDYLGEMNEYYQSV